MASKLVCRMAKVKKNDVKGYQIHNQRERESKTNPHINGSLSYLNRDYINVQNISYMEKWKETFESQNESKRALRKDAVYFNEFVVGSDRDFFKDMDQSEKERFFKVATDFFKERYTEQNVLYSVAHFDELKGAGAHAHIAIVPMKSGKLQSKNVFNRIELKAIQTLLPEHLKQHGFEIERGKEGSKAQHIDTATYKVLKSQEAVLIAERQRETIQGETKLLEAKRENLKELFGKVEQIDSLEFEEQKSIFGKETGKVVIDREDFEGMRDLAMMVVPEMEFKNQELKREMRVLQSEIEQKDDKISNLQKKYEIVSAQAERYKSGVDEVVEERLEEQLEERLEEKTIQLQQEHKIEFKKLQTSKKQVESELIATGLELRDMTIEFNKIGIANYNLENENKKLKQDKQQIEAERYELVKENTVLKSKTKELLDYINELKEKAEKMVNTRLQNMITIAMKSVHLATREWLIEKFPKETLIHLEHLVDRSDIDKRATVLTSEIERAETKEMSNSKNKDMDYER
ncbi:MobV family relaxase [Exiguobacterium sp. 17-1]|uniref:MobV family relaxase n=1 Tax=Exiguobacterium sp. 17-1 TaxID=2931981 RepID=UPI001FFFEDCA|nr:MobV family relaxase [Exiguobacterium sp. 17-1]MCK2159075.1 plasmid recombination protein [Exiguobacterium sp. 17-1]